MNTNETEKHTPGPWSIGRVDGAVVDCNGMYCDSQADRALQAAAPELLAACEAACAMIDVACTCQPYGNRCAACTLLGQLWAAIAKAKGE